MTTSGSLAKRLHRSHVVLASMGVLSSVGVKHLQNRRAPISCSLQREHPVLAALGRQTPLTSEVPLIDQIDPAELDDQGVSLAITA